MARLRQLIDEAQQARQPATPPASPEAANSIADEIVKLADLRTSGVLSDEEFAMLKQRLISGQ